MSDPAKPDFPDLRLLYLTIVAEHQQGARLTELRVDGASNVTLDGPHLDSVHEPGHPVQFNSFSIMDSTGITLRNSLLEGSNRDDPGDPSDGYPTGRGLRLSQSQDITIENNEFRTFWKGMNMSRSSQVDIVGNEFHDMRSDGCNLVSSQQVRVTDNHFQDFRATNRATGDHPDMIQVWTTSSEIPKDLVFARNYLDVGDGDGDGDGDIVQSIFIAHNAYSRSVHGEDIAFENIAITDKVIVGRQVHGISLDTTNGATVSNNVVIAPPNAEDGRAPRISLDTKSTNVTMTGNIAGNLDNVDDLPADWHVANNIAAQWEASHQPGHHSDIFVNAMSDATHAPENLQLLPGGLADQIGAGSSLLIYDATADSARGRTGRQRPTGRCSTGSLATEPPARVSRRRMFTTRPAPASTPRG